MTNASDATGGTRRCRPGTPKSGVHRLTMAVRARTMGELVDEVAHVGNEVVTNTTDF
jgi:hypothetical protein